MTSSVRIAAMVFSLLWGLAMAGIAPAFDWTEEDCSRWRGPQLVECLQAKAEVADTDCSQWTKGEREWRKCMNIRGESERIKREQRRPVVIINP